MWKRLLNALKLDIPKSTDPPAPPIQVLSGLWSPKESALADQFKRFVSQSEYAVVMATFSWCAPCKLIKPVFVSLATSGFTGSSVILTCDKLGFWPVPEDKPQQHRAPTFLMYRKGALLDRIVGANEIKLRQFFVHHSPTQVTIPSVLLPSATCPMFERGNVAQSDVVVIGAGPAGLTAALYLIQARKTVVILEGISEGGRLPGGQLCTTNDVWNFPGFPDGIHGQELIKRMAQQVFNLGKGLVCFVHDDADRIIATSEDVQVHTRQGSVLGCMAVVVATGSVSRQLNVPGFHQYWLKGVYTCATCDGFRFRDKTVVVVGGGDSAAEAALTLSAIAHTTYMIVRTKKLRCNALNHQRLVEKGDLIQILFDCEIASIKGNDQEVTGVVLESDKSTLHCQAVFVAVGNLPNTGVLERSGLSINHLPRRVCVAGDVVDRIHGQAITASADGCRVAMDLLRQVL